MFEWPFGYYVSLYDGICDKTKELEKLTGTMSSDDKWIMSSSGHHMFVSFKAHVVSHPGFIAKIHYGNQINHKIKVLHQNTL